MTVLGLSLGQAANAQELLVHTFLESRPFEGLDIVLDGQRIGQTGPEGSVSAALVGGQHVLRAKRNTAELAEYKFIVEDGESAEISLTFSDFQSKPEFTIATFSSDEPGGPSGRIVGKVVDIDDRPISDALISAAQAGTEVRSKPDGSFALELPRGLHDIEITHPDFETISKTDLRVVANIGIATNVMMLRPLAASGDSGADMDFSDVEEVMVMGAYKPGEDTAELEKFSVAITDSISIDDLLRFGDSDVASALKRIVGVAVTGGKYANVRGLAGRYIGSTLNGNLMPSTDPFRRDVQLDLFPSEILGGIEIQKSFTAEMPADSTGGVILMTTRGLPEEDEAGVSVSLGFVDGVTGESLLTYRGGDQDYTGMDDGARDMPGAVSAVLSPGATDIRVCEGPITSNCVERDQVTAAAVALPRIYNPVGESVNPSLGLSGSLGRRIERDGGDFGYYGALTYSQSSSSRQDTAFTDSAAGDANDGSVSWDTFNVAINGYFVTGWESDAGWDVVSKTMLLRDTEDRTSVVSYIDTTEDRPLIETTLEWVERQFIGQQFEASVPLFDDHELSLSAGITRTTRDAPDRRFYRYNSGSFDTTAYDRTELSVDYLWPVAFGNDIFSTFKFGLMSNVRERDNSIVRLGLAPGSAINTVDRSVDPEVLLSAQNFSDNVFRLRAVTDAQDTHIYSADRDTLAAYVSSETDIGEAWSLTVGARLEDYSLDLSYPFSSVSSSDSNPSDVSDRDTSDVLPSLNLTWRPLSDMQLRAGMSQTLSRPDITEVANTIFYDSEGRAFLGCPSCEESEISNFDLRGEYYFNAKDSLSLALFYKQIDKPLEVTVTDATNVIRTFSNGDSADVYGLEIDGSWLAYDGIDHVLTLSGNIALIESEISLGSNACRVEGLEDSGCTRELQGQSPFLANIQLAYDNYPLDGTATLVINYFDDRIDSVTRGSSAPIFERGRIDINLNAEKTFSNGSKVSLKIKNLLDQPIERIQGGRVRETYKTGSSFTLGYSVSF